MDLTNPETATEQLIYGMTQEAWDALSKEQQLVHEKQDFLDQLQRLQAEFNNYRMRVQREQEESRNAAGEKLLREFIPVIDNLQLALLHAKDADGNIKGQDLLTGVIMINEQIRQMLEHQGLEEIATDGEKFDPHKHEAVTTVPDSGAERGKILQTYQRGYLRNGKVFRAAKVSVAR
jgi:molecular chaperone GrpE